MNSTRMRCARDEGFTLVELTISVAIFFIVFAAVMSLMLSVINTSVTAKAQTTLTNAANSYVERVRAMNYNVVVPGSLTATSTVVNGYALTITPTVSWVDDPTIVGAQNYKKLTVAISGSRAGGAVQRYSVETIIKQPDSGTNPNAAPPTINFTGGSPAEGAEVRGIVNVGAIASANGANVTLTSMNFYVDEVPLQNSFGNTAQWPLNTTASTQTFNWDTEATGTEIVPVTDGTHFLKVECWDSNGRRAAAQRMIRVDNIPPYPPSNVRVALVPTSLQLQGAWDAGRDGNGFADHYVVNIYRQNSSTATDSRSAWGSAAFTANTASLNTLFTPAPLSRYCVHAISVNRTESMNSDSWGLPAAEGFGISRPQITGTWVNTCTYNSSNDRKDRFTTAGTVTVSAPTFPTSSVTNTLLRSTSSAMTSPTRFTMTGYTGTTPASPETTGGITQYYYQVETVVTPVGYNGYHWDAGADRAVLNSAPGSVTLYSNVIGPNSGTAAGTGTLAHVRW